MHQTGHHLPEHVRQFCSLFLPSARVCRLVNRHTGTLLDVLNPDLDLQNDDIPQIVCNPEKAGVQYWIIIPYGNGQAIVPVPKDGSMKVRYLTLSTIGEQAPLTVTPFPTSWIVLPSADCPTKNNLLVPYAHSPEGVYEQWTCLIGWPHFKDNEPRMLDLAGGEAKPDQPVVIYQFGYQKQWQYWLIQFIEDKPKEGVRTPILPSDIAWCPPFVPSREETY